MKRVRACGAVVFEGNILMVRHIHEGMDYWTLPGGGIEPGESPEQAAQREVLEETGVTVSTERFLFTTESARGTVTHCYLMYEPEHRRTRVGTDPEQAHLDLQERMLQDVQWHSLESMRDDVQVSRVIAALGRLGRLPCGKA